MAVAGLTNDHQGWRIQSAEHGGKAVFADNHAVRVDVAEGRVRSPAATVQERPAWLIADGDPDEHVPCTVSAKVLDGGGHEPRSVPVALMLRIHDEREHFAGGEVVDAVRVATRTDRRVSHDRVGP